MDSRTEKFRNCNINNDFTRAVWICFHFMQRLRAAPCPHNSHRALLCARLPVCLITQKQQLSVRCLLHSAKMIEPRGPPGFDIKQCVCVVQKHFRFETNEDGKVISLHDWFFRDGVSFNYLSGSCCVIRHHPPSSCVDRDGLSHSFRVSNQSTVHFLGLWSTLRKSTQTH